MSRSRFISRQQRKEQRCKRGSVDFGSESSSKESASSDGRNISPPLRLPTPKRKGYVRRRRRVPVQTASANKIRFPTSRVKQRKFPKNSTSPTCVLNCENHPSNPLYISTSKQNVQDICPMCGRQDDSVKSIFNFENLPFTSCSESLKCHVNSKSPLHTLDEFYPTSHYYKVNDCNGNFQSEQISKLKQREFYKCFISSPTYPLDDGNYPFASQYFATSGQRVNDFLPFYGQLDSHVKSIYESKNLPFSSPSESLKFPRNSIPQLYTSYEFNDCKRNCCEVKSYSYNDFQGKKLFCSSARTANKAVSSDIHKLILDYIRNSRIPIHICRSLTTSNESSKKESYSQQPSFQTPHSTSKNHSALEESDISPHSTTVQVGSRKTIWENITSSSSIEKPFRSYESSPTYSPELVLYAPHNSWASLASSKETGESENSIESISQSLVCLPDSYYPILKGESTNSRLVSGENGQNDTAPKNENPFKTSTFPVKRHCSSRLQIGVEALSGDTFPLRESTCIGNAAGSNSLPHYSATLYQPDTKSNNSKKPNLAPKENVRNLATLKSKSSLTSFLYQEETLPQRTGEFTTKSKHTESLLNAEEGCSTKNGVKSINQSFASLSLTCGISTTDAIKTHKPSNNGLLFLQENDRSNTISESNNSSMIPCLYKTGPSEKHVSKFRGESNPSQSLPNSEEGVLGPPITDASKMSILFSKSPSVQRAHSRNKMPKKSKTSCFTSCFRPFSIRKKYQA